MKMLVMLFLLLLVAAPSGARPPTPMNPGEGGSAGYYTPAIAPIVASFTGLPLSGAAPLTVYFSDVSSGATATSWAWDFGDGGTSTVKNPSHTYANAGIYTVTMTATAEYSSDDITRVNYITVTGTPYISGVSGTLSYGNTVTLSGTGFGTRDINNNLIYDNLESGSFNSRWSSTTMLTVGNASRHPNSQKAAYHNFTNWRNHAYFTGGSNDPGPWYCQYWFKLGDNWDWGTGMVENQAGATLSNVKFFRMWETGSASENFSMAVAGWENTCAAAVEYTNQGPDYMEGGYMQRWTKGVWHLFQFEFKDSTLGASDGVVRWWIDGRKVYENTHWMTREDETPYKRPYIIGFFNSWGDPFANDNDFWMDDAYIDDSWARVELGDASSYGACTHREIQKPTSWSNTAINVEFNPGSFLPGQTAYLFVVDSTGNVSGGKQVTIVAP